MSEKEDEKVNANRKHNVSVNASMLNQRGISYRIITVGAVFLGIGFLMSLLLVLEHFGGLSLPGCGEGGGCQQAVNSAWGKINLKGFEWPVSYLGVSYLLAVFTAWGISRGALPQIVRYVVRFGVLVSLGFCIIMVVKGLFCPYCIAVHLCNFAFWITMESTGTVQFRRRLAISSAAISFTVATLVLGVCDLHNRSMIRRKAEHERIAAVDEIIDRSRTQQRSVKAQKGSKTSDADMPKNMAVLTGEGSPEQTSGDQYDKNMPIFTGRYRFGALDAPVRIVMFTDYQCRDCYKIEQQVQELQRTRSDVSISIKYFPFCTDCNPAVGRTLHSNACWAVRAAEAAGILWKTEGFWKMHHWLFAQRGVFETTEQLEEGIQNMGYDPNGFVDVMTGEETLRAVRADVMEAKKLGLFFTPMIFINGVELKGWYAPNALVRTVEQVAATNPPERSAVFDRPPLAMDKFFTDWCEQPQLSFPPDRQEWVLGSRDATTSIVMWGDYQEKFTIEADSIIRTFIADHVDVKYNFRHFPVNSDCNPSIKNRRYPYACQAARAAEAAGLLGGNIGYWKMHIWLMGNSQQFNEETLRDSVTLMGFHISAFMKAMESNTVKENILDDIQAGTQLPVLRYGMQPGIFGVPAIFVNNRFVPRWQLDDKLLLKDILVEAIKK